MELIRAGLIKDMNEEYQGPEGSLHDIETKSFSLEVKSHLHSDITDTPGGLVVSSESQLQPLKLETGEEKPLYVVYFPMTKVGNLSLMKLTEDLEKLKQSRQDILAKLSLNGFKEGGFRWKATYALMREPSVYKVDENFPKITPDLYDGQWPEAISSLRYHVCLQNIPSCKFSEFIEAKKNNAEPEFKAFRQP